MAKNRAGDATKAGSAIEQLLLEGRGRDVADTLVGLSGASMRTGRAINAVLVRWLDAQNPRKMTYEQVLGLSEVVTRIMDSGVAAEEAIAKYGGGDGAGAKTVEGHIMPEMAGAIAAFGED